MNTGIERLFAVSKQYTEDGYRDLLEYASKTGPNFWEEVAELIHWESPYTTLCEHSPVGANRWFVGGTINYFKLIFEANDPQKNALTVYDTMGAKKELSYAQLKTEVIKTAVSLRKLGVRPHMTVFVCTGDRETQTRYSLACLSIGARFCHSFFRMPTPGILQQVQAVRADIVVYDEMWRAQEPIPPFSECKSVQHVLTSKDLAEIAHSAVGDRDEFKSYTFSATDTTFVLFSSGTTGTPKAFETGTAGMLATTIVAYYLSVYTWDDGGEFLGLDLAWGPSYMLCVFMPLLFGKRLVIDKRYFDFSSNTGAEVFKNERITSSTLPIALFETDVSVQKQIPLQKLFLTGMKLSQKALRNIPRYIDASNLTVTYGYGSSEISGLGLLQTATQDHAEHDFSELLPYVGTTLKLSETGELLIKNTLPSFFKNIVERPAVYRTMWTEDSVWFRTGDMAKIHNGLVTITGRVDDLTKIKGRFVDLALLTEKVSGMIPYTVCIQKYENKDGVHSLVLFVEKEFEAKITDELNKFIEEEFGHYAVPEIIFVPVFPRLSSGKLDRESLRKYIH